MSTLAEIKDIEIIKPVVRGLIENPDDLKC